ncbi:ABC-2 family transporter protein-domain-containing protein [Chytriomyces sp. MP71]|nr:ABC-2 family transporter protein-domain-containing protein [Chytriomyces sp. MP71]
MAATAEDEFLVARTAGDGDGGQTGLTVLSQPSVGFVQAGTSAQPTAVGVPRKPNQLKALSRKTIAFQKRQLCTNICCICLCPLLMVAISALLGNIINTLIARSQTIEDILYCSNNNSLNSIGWPIYNASDLKVHGVNTTNGKSVNFLSYISFATLEDPGAAVIGAQKPCVLWFGNEYPQFSPIYERNANLTGFTQLDSTYIPPPDGGWIGQLQGLAGGSSYDLASFQKYTSAQQSAWSVVGADPSLTSILGSLPDGGDMTVGGLLDLNLTDLSSPTPYDPATGLLGTMPQRVYLNIVSAPKGSKQPFTLDSAHLYPYFITNTSISTADQVDDALAYHLRKLIADLASLNKTILQIAPTDRTSSQLIDFQIATTQATRQMPTSGLFLTALDAARARLRIVLSVGTDVRVSAAANYPSQGLRQLMLVAQLGQAALRTFGAAGENENLAKATVTQGVRSFPYTQSTALNLPFGGLIGRILYPFGVSFLLPIFVIMLVKEKEDRIYIMMKMNGVKAWAYYLSHYLTFFLLFVVSSLVFILVGRGTKLDLFTKTQPFLLVSFFFLWGNIQVVLAFLISSLFSKSRIALVMTFLVVLIGVVISLVLDTLFEKSWQPAFLNIWPPFAFYRGLSLMNVASYTQGVKPFGNEQFKPGTEFHQICTFLFLEIFVFGALAAYMNAVIPTEFGIPRPWHFPITDLLAYGQTKQRIKRNGGIVSPSCSP